MGDLRIARKRANLGRFLHVDLDLDLDLDLDSPPRMECAAILDACTALTLIEQPRAEEADQLFISTVRMLSKMCLS